MIDDRLKFRAWIGKEKALVAFGARYIYFDAINGLSDFIKNNEGFDVIEQCTGLKDKNGKLIYENDIVRVINQDTKNRPDLQVGEIWVDELNCRWIKFKTEELSLNDFCSLIDYDGTLTIEVIGNIHENADLIKVGGK